VASGAALAVLLDPAEIPEAGTVRFNNLSPVSYALAKADSEGLPWVVVLLGDRLRLYPTAVGTGVGRRGRTETYVEVQTSLLADEHLAYLWLLFSAEKPALRIGFLSGVLRPRLSSRNPGGGLIAMPSAFNVTNRDLIIAQAARYGVPAIYFNRLFANSGGLINYSPDYAEQFRQAPEYINRILKGAKPADLPVQQPTKYELIINLKAAKALGLDVPLHLQQIADELIE
jgi:hypothetical protein